MALVVPTAFLLLAQAAAQTSQRSESATTPIAAPASGPADRCPAPSLDNKTIVVCSDRPQGYRLNPDVIEARREVKSGGRPPGRAERRLRTAHMSVRRRAWKRASTSSVWR